MQPVTPQSSIAFYDANNHIRKNWTQKGFVVVTLAIHGSVYTPLTHGYYATEREASAALAKIMAELPEYLRINAEISPADISFYA